MPPQGAMMGGPPPGYGNALGMQQQMQLPMPPMPPPLPLHMMGGQMQQAPVGYTLRLSPPRMGDGGPPQGAMLGGPPSAYGAAPPMQHAAPPMQQPSAVYPPNASPLRLSDPRRPGQPLPPPLGHPLDGRLPGWRGSIAKSGVPVCNVACVLGSAGDVPPLLNCTARTDLHNLAAHLRQVPFNVFQLAPTTKADVGPMQEFISYLMERMRAGVVQAGDQTLFLVPPSEWAGKVLGVRDPTSNLLAVSVSASLVPAAQPAAPQPPRAFGQGLFSQSPPHQPPQQQPSPGPYGAYAAPQAAPAVPSADELARLVSMVSGVPPR